MAEMEILDLAIIGAGYHGLVAAKTYLEVNPDASVAVFDSEKTIGGVWADRRLYPGLKTNNLYGTYEFSDFPMDTAVYGVTWGQHIPGYVVHQYLKDYAEHFGVTPKIRLETKVLSTEKIKGRGWLLTITHGFNDHEPLKISQILSKKLIAATGMTSDAFLPEFTGSETFGVPIFHIKDFKEYSGTLESAKSVAVFGSTKSSWDAVYQYASKGIKVEWIIRESGHGPTWMAPTHVTPLKIWLEKLVHTRFLTFFSPCIWGDADGYSGIRSFFHGTALGRSITNAFWAILGNDVCTLNKYDSHPETAKLKPWSDPFFIGGSGLSILNYETDFFELVRNGTVSVHIADIEGLAPNTVKLNHGEKLIVDALVCGTGWRHKPALDFLPADLDLGLPHYPGADSGVLALIKKADNEILTRFPRLKQQPQPRKHYRPMTESKGLSDPTGAVAEERQEPFMHYRFMVPPSTVKDCDIAFMGYMLTISVPIISQAQALWVTAYFSGREGAVKMPKDEALVRYQSVLHSRYTKWRYPEGFRTFPDFVFDAVPYLDLLLGDLGLKVHRKGGWRELFRPYGPEDYKGLVREWQALSW